MKRSGWFRRAFSTLEQAIEFIREDQFVEVTQQSIRPRKKVLNANQR